MGDLFSYAERYPHQPGFKRAGTSEDAAAEARERAPILRDRCLAQLKLGPKTADEVAFILGETILNVRPRLSELVRRGLIEDSGARRPNASGATAMVWRVKE